MDADDAREHGADERALADRQARAVEAVAVGRGEAHVRCPALPSPWSWSPVADRGSMSNAIRTSVPPPAGALSSSVAGQ